MKSYHCNNFFPVAFSSQFHYTNKNKFKIIPLAHPFYTKIFFYSFKTRPSFDKSRIRSNKQKTNLASWVGAVGGEISVYKKNKRDRKRMQLFVRRKKKGNFGMN